MANRDEIARMVLRGIDSTIVDKVFVETLQWDELYGEYPRLSTGEQTLLDVALAIWNGATPRTGAARATVAAILGLDAVNRTLVIGALALAASGG